MATNAEIMVAIADLKNDIAEVKRDVEEVKAEAKKTNGRIGKMELWRAGMDAVAASKGISKAWWMALAAGLILALITGIVTILVALITHVGGAA